MSDSARLRQEEREKSLADRRLRNEQRKKQAEDDRIERERVRIEKARQLKGNFRKSEKDLECLLKSFEKTRFLVNFIAKTDPKVLKNTDFKEYYKCF